MVPGPAISELGALGIQIQIEKGKITIKDSKIVAKEGEKISQGAADLMSKLDIKPFSIGFLPLCAFDIKENKFYAEIKVDKEGALENLKSCFGKSLAFAVKISYTTRDTIKFLIGKANSHKKALEKLKPIEKEEEKPTEEIEEKKESDTSEEKTDSLNSSDSSKDSEIKTPEINSGEEK